MLYQDRNLKVKLQIDAYQKLRGSSTSVNYYDDKLVRSAN